MTKKVFLLVYILTTGIYFCRASGIDGVWKASRDSMEITFTFKVNGDKLTGLVTGALGDLIIKDGMVNGNEFSFDVDFGGTIIPHTGRLEGKVIKMKIEIAGENGEVINNEIILKKVE
jgi:hypothetical protein